MLREPALDDLRKISNDYHLKVGDEELKIYLGHTAKAVQSLKLLAKLDNPLSVDQSRLSDRKPQRARPEENPYNAWYQKCTITGAKNSSVLLSGCKVGIKDNIFMAGVPLMNGSKVLEGFVPDFDATVVTRILENGGTITGSTTCENLCYSGASFNTTYGPVRNPWNEQYSAGGSSSGSGVAAAAGDVEMALGCDQGGSIRIPASSCGLVGLKPTHGLVPYTGICGMDASIDHVGPMARSVTDCAKLLLAIAGFDDGKDCRQPSCGFQVPNYLEEISSMKPKTLRIGVLKEGFHNCEETVIKCVRNAVDWIKASNKFLAVDEVSIPVHDDSKQTIMFSVGIGIGVGSSGVVSSSLVKKIYESLNDHAHTLHPALKQHIISSAYVKTQDPVTFFANYADGQTRVYFLKKKYDQALSQFDVLLMPTLTKLPAKIPGPSTSLPEILEATTNMVKNTHIFNMTHHPALTLNAGYDQETGLPIGLQLVGRLWDDATVLKAAKLVEEILLPVQRSFPNEK